MNVAGIDFSSRAIDIVRIPYETAGDPQWDRFPLEGDDAFDRARDVAHSVPGRQSAYWDDTVAVGIEHPAGRHGVGPLLRIQGAVLGCIPQRMRMAAWPPSSWRKAVGLPGNASKAAIRFHAETITAAHLPEQDACDAYLIALATRAALHKEHTT